MRARDPTQVKRALDDLGVQVIYALSPQAKGRVERLWGTLQDRLVSELRLAQTRTLGEANKVLAKYRIQHNTRFAVPPENANSAWRPCPKGLTADEICAFQYVRVVQNNNTVRIGSQVIDIRKHSARTTFANATVLVRHLLRGEYRVYYQGERIAWARAPRATEPMGQPRTVDAWTSARERKARWRRTRGVTESLAC